MSALYAFGETGLYTTILQHWGILPFSFPFLDLHNLFAAWECDRLGIDVFAQNPCDALGRKYGYPPLWLIGSSLNLGIPATNVTGCILDLIFILSLFLLPPARRLWELALVLGGSLSTMVAFAVERANLDIAIFLLALLTGILALRESPGRLLAYATALLAGMLKFYPITLLILCVRERSRTFLVVALALFGAIAIYFTMAGADAARVVPLIATGPYYTDLFAAKTLPFALADLLQHPAADAPVWVGQASTLAIRLYALCVVIGAIICWLVLKSGRLRVALTALDPDVHIFLVIGSALIVGCFFAGQNIGYRGIFFLLAVPGFLALARNASSRGLRAVCTSTSVVIVFLMWGECIRQNLLMIQNGPSGPESAVLVTLGVFWLLRELAWWWVVSVMAAILVEFVWGSEVVRPLRAVMARRTTSVRET